MPDGIYTALLKKVETALSDISGFAEASLVPKLRKKPSFVMVQDQLPQLVFAPVANLGEAVDELMMAGADGVPKCWLQFAVYVGLATNAEWDREKLFWRLDRREDIRLALWRDTLIVLEEDGRDVWRCDYDPSPGVEPSTPETIDESWQLFLFKVETAQYGSP